MEKRVLMFTARGVSVLIVRPPRPRNVVLRFDVSQLDIGLSEGIDLGIELSPQEARDLAAQLISRAASAEGPASPSE